MLTEGGANGDTANDMSFINRHITWWAKTQRERECVREREREGERELQFGTELCAPPKAGEMVWKQSQNSVFNCTLYAIIKPILNLEVEEADRSKYAYCVVVDGV
jgi:hypothetical protein